MRSLALPAQDAGRSDLLALWAGQSANLAHCRGITELLQSWWKARQNGWIASDTAGPLDQHVSTFHAH